jgi:eukaryotic-like serine/threonine-protein kinase
MLKAIILVLLTLGIISICQQSTLARTDQFLTYENSDFHFKIEYPSNWTKQEVNLFPYQVVRFVEPHSVSAFLIVVRSAPMNFTSATFAEKLSQSKNPLMHVINSTTAKVVGDSKASQVIYYDYSRDRTIKTLDTVVVKNGQMYLLEYRTDPGTYSRYLQVAQKMIDSFQFTK